MGTVVGWLNRFLQGLDSLVYPRLCLGCNRPLGAAGNPYLCVSCRVELPYTQYHQMPENAVTDKFAGRIPLQFGAAYLFFQPGSRTQRIVHALKYYNRPDIAQHLGQLYGQELATQPLLSDVAAIVPVPLHPRRFHERGYNQAAEFGRGLSEALGPPLWEKLLLRQSFSSSQTRHNADQRSSNVADSFVVGLQALPPNPSLHLLLVDDVLTTGATLESCATALLAAHPSLRLSVATIALVR